LELAQNEAVRVVIVTGGGQGLVAGADIAFMEKLSPLAARCFAMLGQKVLSTIENLPQPVIAAVNGFALGGAANSPWPAISAWPAKMPDSGNRR
jgi:enoyl-CoA hydratase